MTYDKFAKFNGLHKSIEPQLIDVNAQYAFTINPHDDLQYNNCKPMQRLENFKSNLSNQLQNMIGEYSEYKFNIELSELGRLHLHGLIRIHDVFSFYSMLPQLMQIAAFELDTWDGKEYWPETYCTKGDNYMPADRKVIKSIDRKLLIASTKTVTIDDYVKTKKRTVIIK